MPVPAARGPLSRALLGLLLDGAGPEPLRAALDEVVAAADGSWFEHDDVQVTLTCLYELHYRGLEGVDDAWEWDPDLVALRTALERLVEAELRARVTVPPVEDRSRAAIGALLLRTAAEDDGPSVSRWVARHAQERHVRELLVHRSVYQLKEADPHTWGIPRIGGAAKAALVEIQADEYGGGDPGRVHAELFARAMTGVGLDATYGRYVDQVPALTLAHPNLMSMLGLNRRLRGALVGHLAAFEATSSVPNRLYGNGLRRLGHDEATTWYFDEHVEADAVHEQIAARDLAGGLVEQEPELAEDVLLGARACLLLEGLLGAHVLACWEAGTSSLREPLP
nr:iron-containing redox enzyme family protein [Cellulomonas massiliensis]